MSNLFLILMNCLLCYLTFFICYQLSLAFIGVSFPLKHLQLPILISAIIAYISKGCFNASASLHTIIVVVACTVLLVLWNKVDILIGLIGALMSFITLTLGSMLLACPFFVELGYSIPSKFNGLSWIFLSSLELIAPAIVLIILKTTSFSLMKYISVS